LVNYIRGIKAKQKEGILRPTAKKASIINYPNPARVTKYQKFNRKFTYINEDY
jgi:hypothetical protein